MIGIGILNYNNYQVTEDCIESVCAFPPTEEYHIIVLDNGSQNDSYSILQEKYSNRRNIEIIKSETNKGFAQGNNQIVDTFMEQGVTDVVLSNSDIMFRENTIDRMISALRNLENAVIVGPKIISGGRLSEN